MTEKQILKHIQNDLYAKYKNAGHILRGFRPEGAMLVPDSIKFSEPYRAAKASYDKAFAELRRFNAEYAKHIQ